MESAQQVWRHNWIEDLLWLHFLLHLALPSLRGVKETRIKRRCKWKRDDTNILDIRLFHFGDLLEFLVRDLRCREAKLCTLTNLFWIVQSVVCVSYTINK